MITLNGKVVTIRTNSTKAVDQWAKDACDRIFSHYSDAEMELMRKKGGNQ